MEIIKTTGFNYENFINGGLNINISKPKYPIISEGITLFYNANDLKELGINAKSLKEKGFPAKTLAQTFGFSKDDLIEAGYSKDEIEAIFSNNKL